MVKAGRPRKYPVMNGPFNDIILEKMAQLGFERLEQFAEYANIGRTTIYDLVRGRVSQHGGWVKPSIEVLVRLAEALEKPAHELLYLLEPEAPGAQELLAFPTPIARVWTVGWVGAGPGQNHALDETYSVVSHDFARGKDLIGFRIKGDSMAGGKRPIHDGDTIIVNKNDKGQSGDVVVARLTDDSMVCKALKVDKFGWKLISLNPMYTNSAPPIIPREDVSEVIGRVVRVSSDMEKLED